MAHFTAAGLSSQRNQSDSFRCKRAAFYQSLKSKVGLAECSTALCLVLAETLPVRHKLELNPQLLSDYSFLHYNYKYDWLRPKLEELSPPT